MIEVLNHSGHCKCGVAPESEVIEELYFWTHIESKNGIRLWPLQDPDREAKSAAIFFLCCWWSLWMLFVLSKFVWIRGVLAIINSAVIGMIFHKPLLTESNHNLIKCSRIVAYPFRAFQYQLLLVKYQVSCWDHRLYDPKDPDWRSWTHTSFSLIYFDTPLTLVT